MRSHIYASSMDCLLGSTSPWSYTQLSTHPFIYKASLIRDLRAHTPHASLSRILLRLVIVDLVHCCIKVEHME